MEPPGSAGDGVHRRSALADNRGRPDERGLGGGGDYHSLALKTDGTVWAWGWNALGQLGDGTTLERHLPVPVAGTARASSVTAPAVDRHAPVVVAGLTGVRSASAGAFHSLSVGMDGTVKAWGWTGYGALGTGGADSWRPVAVPVTKAGVVAAGGFHSVVS